MIVPFYYNTYRYMRLKRINIIMRKLSQKELLDEGIGTFMKKVGKGAGVVAGRALKGLAKAASPTAAGLVSKAGSAIADTAKAVKSATQTPEEKITDYFEDMGYKVVDNGINPGVSDDTKVVKVSEIVYDDQGAGTVVPVSSPFVVKFDKGEVKIIRGPKKTPPSGEKVKKDKAEAAAAQAQPAKPATQPAAQTQPAAAATGARGQTGPRAAKSESPGAAKKRIARAIKSNRPPSKSDIEMLKKAGVKDTQTIGGVTFKNLKRRKKLAESKKSQKSLLNHLHSGSRMNKWLVGR